MIAARIQSYRDCCSRCEIAHQGKVRRGGLRSASSRQFRCPLSGVKRTSRFQGANSSSDTVVRFPANDPSKVETFHAGIGVRALALDSKGNGKTDAGACPNDVRSWRPHQQRDLSCLDWSSAPPAAKEAVYDLCRGKLSPPPKPCMRLESR